MLDNWHRRSLFTSWSGIGMHCNRNMIIILRNPKSRTMSHVHSHSMCVLFLYFDIIWCYHLSLSLVLIPKVLCVLILRWCFNLGSIINVLLFYNLRIYRSNGTTSTSICLVMMSRYKEPNDGDDVDFVCYRLLLSLLLLFFVMIGSFMITLNSGKCFPGNMSMHWNIWWSIILFFISENQLACFNDHHQDHDHYHWYLAKLSSYYLINSDWPSANST